MFIKLSTLNVEGNPDFQQNENSHLGVRAVLIKCEIPEEGFPSDETTRFQREELFKHKALQDCKQKLALTIKMSSDPDQTSGDEYIPIEHVLGVNRKRIRLLNPYVLRLRRKAPFQAYKLRKINTVSGIIAKTFDKKTIKIGTNESRRMQRDLQSGSLKDEDWSATFGSLFKLDHDDHGRNSYSVKIRDPKQLLYKTTAKTNAASRNNYFDHNSYLCPKTNESNSLNRRQKRHMIQDYDHNFARWNPTDYTPQKQRQVYDNTFYKQPSHKINEQQSDTIMYENRERPFDAVDKSNHVNSDILKDQVKVTEKINLNSYNDKEISSIISQQIYRAKSNEKMNNKLHKKHLEDSLRSEGEEEKDFVIYEIGDPDLWYSAQVQLFEKLSTPEGKTLWNDLMKYETASVNTANPEWSNQDVNVQYKPVEFLTREEFLLPLTDLRLVVSSRHDHANSFKGEFVIVPVDDVITLDDPKEINKRDENSSDFNTASNKVKVQRHRQVIVRVTRALMAGVTDSLKIITRGSDRYLKLLHPKPHYTQMDLEARADDNELILVGVLGRLTTIVSDTTRRIRSILTVQATNTGLAAARMRVLIRECSPDFLESSNEREETVAGPVILPPKHTKTFRLTVPLQIPVESANCTIALVNDDDNSVAVRDVRIKRDDRCYCVWHCDCVCLGEDSKLLCRDMTAAQLLAAGLSPHQKTRHARSVCYPDVVALNLFVTFVGVLLALLNLGIMKAFLGLICRCVGSWGLQLLLQAPRKLDHYYEFSLRNRRVVYDDEGWPVHPDTKERTVRLVSKSMEFMLNVIFFLTLPCVMIWDSMKKLTTRCQGAVEHSDTKPKMSDTKKCFSSHDVQVTERRLRRSRGLRKWMTPQAEELTTDLWHEGLTPVGINTRNCLQPLIQDETCFRKSCEQSSFVDSEQDDTKYVLMQMQKSRESLARSQRQQKTKTSAMKQWKGSNE